MKNLLKTIYFLGFAILLTQCSKEQAFPDNLVVKDFVWKSLNAYYLHQEEVAALSDRRFNSDKEFIAYLSSFTDYNTLFSSVLIASDVKSFLVEDFNNVPIPEPRTGVLNGLEFGVFKEQDSDTVLVYAVDILPLSYAATQTISRGDYFYAIVNTNNDTINLRQDNYEALLLNYSQDTLKLVKTSYDGENLIVGNETVALVKRNYSFKTAHLEKIFSEGGEKIGYLMYNNNFSKHAIHGLNNTFLNFKNEAVSELILDLRYNIGGGSFAKNMANLASMITGQFSGEVFIKEQWNSKAQSWFETNQPDSLLTRFPHTLDATTPFHSLHLTDLYIILNGTNYKGSSAIELLINSLKPHINVHLIGSNTEGNNTGAITVYNSEDYNFPMRNETHSVALQPMVLRFLNKSDQTYENGFSPNMTLCDHEDVLNLGTLGERTDPILDRVLEAVNSGDLGVHTPCNPKEYIYLHHSINAQKTRDSGVFIEQILPNTN
jgi:C-terminal processing protease CtpA/Prc